MARDVAMRAHVYRGEAGFWMARVESAGTSPERASAAHEVKTIILPIPHSATREEAERALAGVVDGDPGLRHGRR